MSKIEKLECDKCYKTGLKLEPYEWNEKLLLCKLCTDTALEEKRRYSCEECGDYEYGYEGICNHCKKCYAEGSM